VPIAATGPSFSAFPGPTDLNGSGRVAFVAGLTGGGQGVFTGDGGSVTTIAASGAAFAAFGEFVSINTAGGVTFAATLAGGGQGVFTGSDPVLNKVIRTGDALLGSTVLTVAMAPGAINDLGQVAFTAQLVDGRQVVVIATPVPEPACVVAISGAALAAGAWWRRRGRI
jgi:hypothetical protein